MTKWPIRKTEPTGTTHGFGQGLDGKCLGIVEIPDYERPEYSYKITNARIAAGLGLRPACKLLGFTPVELSGLEHGRYVFVDPEDAEAVLEALRRYPDG